MAKEKPVGGVGSRAGSLKSRAPSRSSAQRKAAPDQALRKTAPDWATYVNAFLTTIISLAILVVAIAQFRLAESQGDIATSLAKLEFAKSAAKFDFETSQSTVPFGPSDDPHSISLPRAIIVQPMSGVRAIETMDGPVSMLLTDEQGNDTCDIEVHGLYLEQGKKGVMSLWEPPLSDFRAFLETLRLKGLKVTSLSPDALVRFSNVLGTEQWRQFSLPNGMELGGPSDDKLILYSGAWSNGQGFYFNDNKEVANRCPKFQAVLKKVVAVTGGGSGAE